MVASSGINLRAATMANGLIPLWLPSMPRPYHYKQSHKNIKILFYVMNYCLGCVDIWAPKVLRAGAGCHFRTRVINNLGWQMLGTYIPDEAQVLIVSSQRFSHKFVFYQI